MGDWPHRPSFETRKRLNSALNEILIYCCDELAEGWEIVIRMIGGEDGKGDCSIELSNPDGDEVSRDWDTESRNTWSMVDHSRNPDDATAREVDESDSEG